MNKLCLFLLVFRTTALGASAAQLPDDLLKKLSAAIRECCPDAQIEVNHEVFTAKRGTMTFTLHSVSKTGEVYPQTHQQEGPNFKGFILTVSLREGPYLGAATTPQTLQGPYFPTFIDAPATADGKGHFWVTFSYGKGIDEEVRSAILGAIPKTRFQPDRAASRSRPIGSETNSTSGAVGSGR
jgi:hypothetical protein